MLVGFMLQEQTAYIKQPNKAWTVTLASVAIIFCVDMWSLGFCQTAD